MLIQCYFLVNWIELKLNSVAEKIMWVISIILKCIRFSAYMHVNAFSWSLKYLR